jgi:hypothetical protein
MDNFDLIKYLVENRLIQEDRMIEFDEMHLTNNETKQLFNLINDIYQEGYKWYDIEFTPPDEMDTGKMRFRFRK